MGELMQKAWHVLVATLIFVAVTLVVGAIIEKGLSYEPHHRHRKKDREEKAAWLRPRKNFLDGAREDLFT